MVSTRFSVSLFSLFSLTTTLACGDDPPVAPPPVNNQVTLSTLSVAPATSMLRKDESITLRATGTYSDGTTKSETSAVWTSSDEAIAVVSSSGVVTALSVGTVELTATIGAVSGNAQLAVISSALIGLDATPDGATLAPGATATFTVLGSFDDDTTADVTGVLAWSSSNEAVATVAAGVVTAAASGEATITARDAASDLSISLAITVRIPPPAEIIVAPSSSTLPIGRSVQLSATAVLAGGEHVDVSGEVSFVSSAPAVVSVDASGNAVALTQGFASITARHDSGVSGVASIRATQAELASIRVTPEVAEANIGARITFEAIGTYTDGVERNVSGVVTWSSSTRSVVSIDDAGLAIALALGNATITARDSTSNISSTDTNQSATFRVVPPSLTHVLVLPSAISIAAGLSTSLEAFGVYSDNSGQDLTNTVIWSSSDETIATVDPSGTVTGLSVGTVTITATDPTSGTSSGATSSAVTVDPAILVSISVSPPTAAMVVGSAQQFTANGLYSDGATVPLTSGIVWRSSTAALSISPAGLGTAVSLGTVDVSVTHTASGISSDASNQSAQVFIADAALVSISITPPASTVPPGADVAFRAIGLYNNNSTVDLTTIVTWTTSDPAVATISNVQATRGIAGVLSPGVAEIVALDAFTGISSSDSNGSATLTAQTNVSLVSVNVSSSLPQLDVGDTQQFLATGTFSDATTHPMTHSVSWSSSNNAIAAVSNTEGSRGVVRGIAEGVVDISAEHVPTSISSNTFSLTVDQSIEIADVVHYELEEGSGTTVTNLAPGQPNGTINGTATWLSPGAGVGDSNFRLRMAGTGTTNVNSNLPATTFTNLTIEFWWRWVSGAGLAYAWNSASSFRAFTNGVAGTGFMVRVTPGGTDITHNVNMQNGQWHHIAYVLDATALQGRLYVNGVLAGSTVYSGSIPLSSFFLLGQNSSSGAEVDYDRFRIWSTPLTPAQIGEIMTGNR
jgi:uncharacterized protein YjdB